MALPRRAAAAALAAALLAPRPAAAFLGFGGASKDEVYAADTVRGGMRGRGGGAVALIPCGAVTQMPAPRAIPTPSPLQASVITAVRAALALDRDDPGREAAVAGVRGATNDWVAKYRRDQSFSGKLSYGNTYSALNAVAGHINSFGADVPLPKKRLDRVTKELDDAEKLLARGR